MSLFELSFFHQYLILKQHSKEAAKLRLQSISKMRFVSRYKIGLSRHDTKINSLEQGQIVDDARKEKT